MVMLLRFPASIDRARVDLYPLPGDAVDFPATMGQLRNSITLGFNHHAQRQKIFSRDTS